MSERMHMNLAGEWRFAFDPAETGINYCGGWYDLELPERVILPGGTHTNHIGIKNTVMDKDNIGEPWIYIGAAWYQRDIEIPQEWAGKQITLYMERTSHTMVWLDGIPMGSNDDVQVPQYYALGAAATPGRHNLTIRVNNKAVRPLQYAARTLNGIMGEVSLQATDPVCIRDVKVTPHVDNNRATIEIWLQNQTGVPVSGMLNLAVESQKPIEAECTAEQCSITHAGKQPSAGHRLRHRRIQFVIEEQEKKVWIDLWMGDDCLLWDEFTPNVYELTVTMEAGGNSGEFGAPEARRTAFSQPGFYTDRVVTTFGMRDFRVVDRQFSVNGKKVILRGDMPMGESDRSPEEELAYWRALMKEYKKYGINMLRFHTTCPREAALTAADEAGIYMQLELKLWAWICFPDEPAFEPLLEGTLKKQGDNVLKAYGNHPSFVMMSLGNEIQGDYHMLGRVVAHLRETDPSRLYAQGTNNNLDDPFPLEGDDFFISNKARFGHKMMRGSCAHADYPLGKIQNEELPDTWRGFGESLDGYEVPVIGHEIGQYETSPNFDDLMDFPADEQPRNLLLFRQTMEQKGLLPKEKDFFAASGKLSALCYREDIEMYYRTPGMGGFQLLALRDCLGQGSSMVGILNYHGKPKGNISPEEWRRFCNDRVMLLRMPGYIYRGGELFHARVDAANFGCSDMPESEAYVRIYKAKTAGSNRENGAERANTIEERAAEEGLFLEQLLLPAVDIRQGDRAALGWIDLTLPKLEEAAELTVEIGIEKYGLKNCYPIWVFPQKKEEQAVVPTDALITSEMNETILGALQEGRDVFYVPENLPPRYAVEGFWASNFWSYDMFANMSLKKGVPVMPGTLGLCCQTEHPALGGFPTGIGSSWQWWRIVMESSAVILDGLPLELDPIVSVIDNPMRCCRLGMIFEARVGAGRLLVASAALLQIRDKYPEAACLYDSLITYMNSEKFCPHAELTPEQCRERFFVPEM